MTLALLVVVGRGFLAQVEHRGDDASAVIALSDGADAAPSSARPSAATAVPSPTPAPTRAAVGPVTSVVRGVRCTGPGDADSVALARAVQTGVGAAAAGRDDEVSLALRDRASGVECALAGDEQYPSASIIKVATAAALVWRADRDGESPSEAEWEQVRRAIVVSDNAAQSRLWSLVGGTRGMSSFVDAVGMSGTEPDGQWGLTLTTAADQAKLVDRLVHTDLLPAAGRQRLLGFMRTVDPTQAWGVGQGVAPGRTVALKNGWYPGGDGWRVHSVGAVTGGGADYTLAVLTVRNPTQDSGIDTVEDLVDAVHAALDDPA